MTSAGKTVVLQVVGAMNRGGAETFMMNVLRNIDKNKFELIFLCYLDGAYDYEDEVRSLGGRIIRIKDTRVRKPHAFIMNIVSIIKENSVNIVHSHVDYTTSYSMLAAKKAGVTLRIAHSHNTRATRSTNLARKIFPLVSKYIINRYASVRLACEESAGKALFYKKNRFEIIRNGINLEDFAFNISDRSRVRQSLSIDVSTKVILHVGRFEEQKNHTYLIDMFSTMTKGDPNIALILVGDGSLTGSVRSRVNELGLGDSVFFVGKQSDMASFYSMADIFLLPSLYEGLPVSLIEAQANGLRCLVSDTTDRNSDLGLGLASFISLRDEKTWIESVMRAGIRNDVVNLTKSKRLRLYDIKSVTERLEIIYSNEK